MTGGDGNREKLEIVRKIAEAKKKNDPRKRGLLEDGFKVYIEGGGTS